jgi:hypothetical protein
MKSLLPAKTLAALPPAKAATITGKQFFPKLMSQPFLRGLRYAFSLSVVIFLIAAVASWLRGDQRLPPGAVLDRADEFGSGDLIELEPDQPALR